MKEKHLAQEREKKKESTKVQTKITHENAESTTQRGALRAEKHET
jgi:hypothetical protein